MSHTGIIYGLIDPYDRLIYYVGKSKRGVLRAWQHSSSSRLEKDGNDEKVRWIRELLEAGTCYEVIVLDVDASDQDTLCWWWSGMNATSLNDLERWWIAYGTACGWPLLNLTAGGEGALNAHPKTRAKMSVAARSRTDTRTRSPESRRRQSERAKSKGQRPGVTALEASRAWREAHPQQVKANAKKAAAHLTPEIWSRGGKASAAKTVARNKALTGVPLTEEHRSAIRAATSTPEQRERASRSTSRLWQDPVYRATRVEKMRLRWKDPDYREKVLASRKRSRSVAERVGQMADVETRTRVKPEER